MKFLLRGNIQSAAQVCDEIGLLMSWSQSRDWREQREPSIEPWLKPVRPVAMQIKHATGFCKCGIFLCEVNSAVLRLFSLRPLIGANDGRMKGSTFDLHKSYNLCQFLVSF